jgi:hypothetical protein
MSGAEESEVPDANKPSWKHVQQKAPKELVHGQTHPAFFVLMRRVAPPKDYVCALQLDKAVIRYGDSMCVAAQISKDLSGTPERPLAVDHPVFAERLPQQISEALDTAKWL